MTSRSLPPTEDQSIPLTEPNTYQSPSAGQIWLSLKSPRHHQHRARHTHIITPLLIFLAV